MIEKSRPGVGATAFSGGILRGFHLDPLLADQCVLGLRHYADLARETRGDFSMQRTGFLQLIDGPHLAQARQAYERLAPQLALEWLSPEDAAQRFGLASHVGLSAAVHEPDAGHADPLLLARLYTSFGQRDGGEALTGVELLGVDSAEGKACGLSTNIGQISCDQVVLCTGAWTPALTQRLGAAAPTSLRAKAIQVNLISRPRGAAPLPAFVDLSTEAYGRPQGADTALIGCPVDAWDIDPDTMITPTESARQEALTRARQRFAWIDDSVVLGGYRRHDAYDSTGRGVVAWAPARPGVLIAAGFSGNGVKLAPATAEAVAALLQAHSEAGAA